MITLEKADHCVGFFRVVPEATLLDEKGSFSSASSFRGTEFKRKCWRREAKLCAPSQSLKSTR